ncbi:MAG TPA: TatD family hydrolase, partial [Gemmatimonadales bacterium]|nr:TatD family hydrolase [Gemmatimonadales bacterium]
MLIDTHCHLAASAYDADRAEVLERAWTAGVERVVVVGESPEASDRALALARAEPRLATTAGI